MKAKSLVMNKSDVKKMHGQFWREQWSSALGQKKKKKKERKGTRSEEIDTGCVKNRRTCFVFERQAVRKKKSRLGHPDCYTERHYLPISRCWLRWIKEKRCCCNCVVLLFCFLFSRSRRKDMTQMIFVCQKSSAGCRLVSILQTEEWKRRENMHKQKARFFNLIERVFIRHVHELTSRSPAISLSADLKLTVEPL